MSKFQRTAQHKLCFIQNSLLVLLKIPTTGQGTIWAPEKSQRKGPF